MKLYIYPKKKKKKQWDYLFPQKLNGWKEMGTRFLITDYWLNVRSNVSRANYPHITRAFDFFDQATAQ